jgi:putative GTP pyrophosphokinase
LYLQNCWKEAILSEITEEHIAALRAEYDEVTVVAGRLLSSLKEQLATIVEQNDISLAVPIETRVKSWESIREKLERKGRSAEGLAGITDIAGIRLITLFQSDVEKLDELIRSMLDITEAEDTSNRLDDSHFGYRSNHYVGRIPSTWLKIPSYRGLGKLCAEIQVRTLPQHMWAAASHKLQYKREDSAPPRLRRAINRVSAILETVDLEFTRILEERVQYVQEQVTGLTKEIFLNVDNISTILNDVFPIENKSDREPYDELLNQLKSMGITKIEEFRSIMEDGKISALESDKTEVKRRLINDDITPRIESGVFYKHVGLAREAMRTIIGSLPGDDFDFDG